MKKDNSISIDRSSVIPQWYDFNNSTKFKIRPFKQSAQTEITVMPMLREQFMYCLVDWEGIKEDDKKMPVDQDSKEYLYDYYPEIRDFVIGNAREFMGADKEELKN